MSLFVRDKYFYKTLLAITIPIALQNLISFAVSMADTLMLGQLGEIEISASSLANQPIFIFNILTFGIGAGACVLIAQYWGKKDMKSIKSIFGIAIKFAMIAAIVFTIVIRCFPNTVMSIFTNDDEVIKQGATYLKVMGFSFIFFGFTNTMLCTLRSIEVVRISVGVYASSLLINVFINWVLIFGNLGFTAMGIKGAAIGTLCAKIWESIIVFIYVAFIDKKLQLKIKDIIKIPSYLYSDFFKYGSIVIVNEFLWAVAMSAQSAILGHLGTDAVAANSICSVINQLATVIVFGVANASTVIIGKEVGANRYDNVKKYSTTLQVIYVIMGVSTMITMFLFRDIALSFFNISASTKALAYDFLGVLAFVLLFLCYTAPVLIGVLRGGGDTRFVIMLDLIFIWCVTLPLGFIAAFVLKLPMPVVYIFLKVDEIIKAFLGFFRLKSGKWIKNVTRD